VINTLICDNGRVGSAPALSARLGLRSRYQLGRLLQREGLPPYEELAGWVCVFYWMLRADAGDGGGALRSLSHDGPINIASSYRLVRRVTGHSWNDLRRAGTEEVVRWFRRRVRQPSPRPRIDIRTVRESNAAPSRGGGAARWPDTGPCRLALPGKPWGIGVRGRDLAYITRADAAALERLDLRTGRFAGSIPVGCTPTCVAFDSAGTYAYVSVQYCDEIAVIDVLRHACIRTYSVPGDPFAIALSPSGRTLFVTTNEDALLGLATSSGRVLGSIPLPATSHHLALHPAGDRLYVATRAAGSVLEVDTTRYRVLRSFELGGWPQGVVVSPDGTTLYAANERQGLDAIRLGTGAQVTRLESERGAVSLALSPDRRFLYTGLVHAGQIGVIEVSSLTRRGSLETGGRPGQIAFDGNGRVIVPNTHGWVDILPVGGLRVGRQDRPPEPRTGARAFAS
jgi:DNA-binding beta-propeller fold protein YncE